MELSNNVSSLNSSMRSVRLIDGFAGPVQNLQASEVTNQSAQLMWMPPSIPNGALSGYSVYANDSTVSVFCIITFSTC